MKKRPLRPAFFVSNSDAVWMGGNNLLRNLFYALRRNPQTAIEPVLLQGWKSEFSSNPNVEVVDSTVLNPTSLVGKIQRKLSADRFLLRELHRHRIDLLSHPTVPILQRARFPMVAWLPDLRHLKLPQSVEVAERTKRDANFTALCDASRLIILSSFDALGHFKAFFPRHADQGRVLRFVSCFLDEVAPTPAEALRAKYEFTEPFFLVPNQFWPYKNQMLIVEALRSLEPARRPLVLSTGQQRGQTDDRYYREVRQRTAEYGLENRFRPLGLVPAGDLKGLFLESIAIVNPSFFEGWSTSVEESKSLGKRMLLSDFEVHREQAPPEGLYFSPHDAQALAQCLVQAQSEYDPAQELKRQASAAAALPGRVTEFAETYEAIVREALAA